MATPPDFSSGAILTAAQMNSVGLWKVASGSLSTATTNFQGCFTSEYRDYRIVIDSLGFSGAGDIYVRFLVSATPSTTADYFWALRGINSSAGIADNTGSAQTLIYCGASASGATAADSSVTLDILSPQLATKTIVLSSAFSLTSGVYVSRAGGAAFDVSTQFNGLQFISASAVTLSGNVTIYGYRK